MQLRGAASRQQGKELIPIMKAYKCCKETARDLYNEVQKRGKTGMLQLIFTKLLRNSNGEQLPKWLLPSSSNSNSALSWSLLCAVVVLHCQQ